MRQKRFTTAAAELNGSIFVTGGYDDQYLSSTERFDPREGRWVQVRFRA
jgi:kelch-like protein 20